MHDEFPGPVRPLGRSIGGSWNAYDLWRTTIEVPRKVQLIAAFDDDDVDDDPRYARRRAIAIARKIVGAIVFLMLLSAPFVSSRSDACSIGNAASAHDEILRRITEI